MQEVNISDLFLEGRRFLLFPEHYPSYLFLPPYKWHFDIRYDNKGGMPNLMPFFDEVEKPRLWLIRPKPATHNAIVEYAKILAMAGYVLPRVITDAYVDTEGNTVVREHRLDNHGFVLWNGKGVKTHGVFSVVNSKTIAKEWQSPSEGRRGWASIPVRRAMAKIRTNPFLLKADRIRIKRAQYRVTRGIYILLYPEMKYELHERARSSGWDFEWVGDHLKEEKHVSGDELVLPPLPIKRQRYNTPHQERKLQKMQKSEKAIDRAKAAKIEKKANHIKMLESMPQNHLVKRMLRRAKHGKPYLRTDSRE